MSFYNTGNPVPSLDPRDLDDNAKHLDEFVNGTEPTYTDRLGVERKTLSAIESDADSELLRNDLGSTSDPSKGAVLVGRSSFTVNFISDLQTAPRRSDLRALVLSSVAGFTAELGPRGGGEFFWSPSSTEVHDGAIIFKPSDVVGSGRWKRIVKTEILASWFGIVPDGRDNGDAINSMIAYASLIDPYKCIPMVFESGEYITSKNHTLKPHMRIATSGFVRIKFTGTGTLFHIAWAANDPLIDVIPGNEQNMLGAHKIFSGSCGALTLVGSGGAGGQVAVEYGGRSSSGVNFRVQTVYMSSEHLFISRFQYAWKFNSYNSCLISHYSCHASNCGTIISDNNGTGTNYGEQFNWISCSFHNSVAMAELNASASHQFTGCSIDYIDGPKAFIFNKGYHTVRFIGGHFEYSGGLFAWADAAGSPRVNIFMDAAWMYPQSNNQKTWFDGPISVTLVGNLNHVFRYNKAYTNYLASAMYLCTDAVTVVHSRGMMAFEQSQPTSYSMSRNRNGRFDVDAVGTSATAALPTAITGWTRISSSINPEISSTYALNGTKSLKIPVVSANQSWHLISDKFPVSPGEIVHQFMALMSPAGDTLNMDCSIRFYNAAGVEISVKLVQDTQVLPALVWISFRASINATAPPGATTATITVGAGAVDSDMYVSDSIAQVL